ncbi:pyruvate formate lyase-activating protein [Clostridia bacterium]|nr:pyruvate formate lyase-activating protein [Clostridia bacterium]
MTETYVLNIQRYSLHDGAGIRTTVFLKGCPMRCLWCCNPESQKYEPEISYVPDKCIGFADCGFCADSCTASAIHHDAYTGKAVIDRDKCTSCLNCAEICPSKAIKTEGRVYSVSEILSVVEKDAMFYRRGGGGLTVSGGEPLMHGKFLIPLLKEAQRRRINTAIETCGFANYDTLREAAKYLDTIFYDIKSANSGKHLKYTGCGNELILDNFTRLCDDFPDLEKTVRTPVIPGFNDAAGDIDAIRGIIKGKPGVSFETLPYHRFGEGKYKALGRKYEMEGKSNA